MDSLPITNQRYNNSIFTIAVYRLIVQEPGIVSSVLDSITSRLYGRSTPASFIEILPMSRAMLKMNTTIIDYPKEKKVSYLWICRKTIQLLLWTESRRAKNMDVIEDDYKITMAEINENVIKVQQIMSDYASHLTFNPVLLGSGGPSSAENSTLPTYQNAITSQGNVGTSNSYLTSRAQQGENSSETNGQVRENRVNNPFQEFKLSYCFDGSDKLQARSFINDYDCLALRNRWSSEEKLEFFPNHLEKAALTWYITMQDQLTSWKTLKVGFMQNYLIE
jgi:hypothetical protein